MLSKLLSSFYNALHKKSPRIFDFITVLLIIHKITECRNHVAHNTASDSRSLEKQYNSTAQYLFTPPEFNRSPPSCRLHPLCDHPPEAGENKNTSVNPKLSQKVPSVEIIN